jgi:hypothetical protein
MSRPPEVERLRREVAGMPAPQALRFLAELLRPGSSPTKGRAIAAHVDAIADAIDEEQQVVRRGLPVDSTADGPVQIREYALRATHPDGTVLFMPYGDRLFSAVRDGERMPNAEILHRDVTVGPWVADTEFTDEGLVRFRDDPT